MSNNDYLDPQKVEQNKFYRQARLLLEQIETAVSQFGKPVEQTSPHAQESRLDLLAVNFEDIRDNLETAVYLLGVPDDKANAAADHLVAIECRRFLLLRNQVQGLRAQLESGPTL